jgi:hypothetical protein
MTLKFAFESKSVCRFSGLAVSRRLGGVNDGLNHRIAVLLRVMPGFITYVSGRACPTVDQFLGKFCHSPRPELCLKLLQKTAL